MFDHTLDMLVLAHKLFVICTNLKYKMIFILSLKVFDDDQQFGLQCFKNVIV